MGIYIFGMMAVLAGLLLYVVHTFTGRMEFQRRSLKNSILSSTAAAVVCVAAIIAERAWTPESLSVWFHQHPDKAILLTRFIEAPLAFLVSLPVFWLVYREPLAQTAKLSLILLLIFFIL